MTEKELKAKRVPVLAKREANRSLGTPSLKVEAECNAELRKLNMAIAGDAPYEAKAKKTTKKKADPLS